MEEFVKNFKKYLYLCLRRRFLIMFVSVVVMLPIIGYSFFITKEYESTSTVFIEKNVIDSLLKGITVTPSMQDRIRVLKYDMLRRDMVRSVLQDLDAEQRVETQEGFENLVQRYREKPKISQRGNDLFIVSLIDEDPVFAKNFINALVQKYVEENVSSKRQEAYGADRFITEQLSYFKDRLDKFQNRIIQFRREKGIYSVVDEGSLLQNIDELEKSLKELKTKRAELEAAINTINKQIVLSQERQQNQQQDVLASLDMPQTEQKSPQVRALEDKLSQLLLTYNDKYPEVQRVKAQLKSIKEQEQQKALEMADTPGANTSMAASRQQPRVSPNGVAGRGEAMGLMGMQSIGDMLYLDLQTRLNTKESELKALEARMNDIQGEITKNKRTLRDYPEDKKVLSDLKRERNIYQTLYEQLLQRQSVAEVSKQMEVADKSTSFRIVDPAITPNEPVSMDRIMVMLFGVFAGFGVGIGLAILIDMLAGKLNEPEDLEGLGVTVLAEIPNIPDPVAQAKSKRWQRWGYALAGCGYSLAAVLIGHDMLGLQLIDELLSQTQFADQVKSLLGQI